MARNKNDILVGILKRVLQPKHSAEAYAKARLELSSRNFQPDTLRSNPSSESAGNRTGRALGRQGRVYGHLERRKMERNETF